MGPTFFDEIQLDPHGLVVSILVKAMRGVGTSISTRTMALTLYVSENGVSPFAMRAVVLYAYRTNASSSAHAPLFSSSFFLRVSFRVLFTASTKPLS